MHQTTPSRPAIEPLEARIAPAFSATFDLASLNGFNGFSATGEQGADQLGSTVDIVGDMNADGFDDVFIGSSLNAGYVVFGKASGFPKKLDLASLDGTNGFKVVGHPDDGGLSVRAGRAAGDVNGDGADDLIVSLPDARGGDGLVFVVFGKKLAQGPFAPVVTLGDLNGTDGFAILASQINGRGVPAGDFNDDGFDDIMVGGHTSTYVVFGKASGFAAETPIANITGAAGVEIQGSNVTRFARAGDVNHDGIGDLLFSAADSLQDNAQAYVLYGTTTPFAAPVVLSTISAAAGFMVVGNRSGNVPQSLGPLGDVSGDGIDDFFLAGPFGGGQLLVIYGRDGATAPFPASILVSSLDGINGVRFAPKIGDSFVVTGIPGIAGGGDVNADGIADLLIPTRSAVDATGRPLLVLYGGMDYSAPELNAAGAPIEISADTLNGIKGFSINVTAESVSNTGDVNGDGIDDLVIGQPIVGTNFDGSAFVVFGKGPVEISTNGRTATVSEADGDLVTVKSDLGTFHISDFTFEDGALQAIDLTRDVTGFRGSIISVSAVTPSGGKGDGEVNVGWLNATGIDLGPVNIDGDLGRVTAGDGDFASEGMGGLTVYSLGRYGLTTQAAGGSLESEIAGGLSGLKVLTSITGASVNAAGGHIGALVVEGSMSDAKIGAGTTLGSVTILGDLVNSTISAIGTPAPGSVKAALAIKSFFVGGNVENSLVLAGYNFAGEAKNPDVQIGPVKVDGLWNASTLVAGAVRGATDMIFGTTDDALIGAVTPFTNQTTIKARIASITIKNGVLGTGDVTTDHFGFVAEEIGSFKVGTTTFPLTTGLDNLPVGATDDVNIFEVGAVAPATPPVKPGLIVAATGKVATYTDADGDFVTVKSSKGGLVAGMFTFKDYGDGFQQLQTLDLTTLATASVGTDITFTAKRSDAGGDGFVHVGYVKATGRDLGKVTIAGDLGRIDAGDGDAAKPAVKALTASSIGVYGSFTQDVNPSLDSNFAGTLGALTLRTNLHLAKFTVADGGVGTVKIDGDFDTSKMFIDGPLGSVTIGGDLHVSEIRALGTLAPASAAKAVAIKSLKIGGIVNQSKVLAGYGILPATLNGDASIGAVTVAGSWVSSSLVAGVADVTADGFGRNDAVITNTTPTLLAKIASVTIKGSLFNFGATHHGITAEQIGKLIVSGTKFIVKKGADDFQLDPENGKLRAVDFA